MRPYMTEEEAQKKWCPLLLAQSVSQEIDAGVACCEASDDEDEASAQIAEGHVLSEVKLACRCHSSDCMFWGWEALTSCPGEGQAPRTFASTTKGRCEAPGGAA